MYFIIHILTYWNEKWMSRLIRGKAKMAVNPRLIPTVADMNVPDFILLLIKFTFFTYPEYQNLETKSRFHTPYPWILYIFHPKMIKCFVSMKYKAPNKYLLSIKIVKSKDRLHGVCFYDDGKSAKIENWDTNVTYNGNVSQHVNVVPYYWPIVMENAPITNGFPSQRHSNVGLWC